MSSALGRFECSICGRTIFYPISETDLDGAAVIELTCSRGHTDRYSDARIQLDLDSVNASEQEMRVASVGF